MRRAACTISPKPDSRCWCAMTPGAWRPGFPEKRLPAARPTCGAIGKMLPIAEAANIVSLGEVTTPLIALSTIAGRLGAGRIDVKDEGRLPTGSFKARGITVAISMAKETRRDESGDAHQWQCRRRAQRLCQPWPAWRALCFCPEDTPEINIAETGLQGGRVFRVNGFINDCGKLVGDGRAATGWFDMSDTKGALSHRGQEDHGSGNSANSLAGRCRTLSSIPPAAAPGLSACGRRLMNWSRWAGWAPGGREWWRCRHKAALRS